MLPSSGLRWASSSSCSSAARSAALVRACGRWRLSDVTRALAAAAEAAALTERSTRSRRRLAAGSSRRAAQLQRERLRACSRAARSRDALLLGGARRGPDGRPRDPARRPEACDARRRRRPRDELDAPARRRRRRRRGRRGRCDGCRSRGSARASTRGAAPPRRHRARAQLPRPTTAASWRALGAERTLAVATSAVRDAENGEAFLGEVEWSYGFATRLLSRRRGGALTFRGVTAGRGSSPGRWSSTSAAARPS